MARRKGREAMLKKFASLGGHARKQLRQATQVAGQHGLEDLLTRVRGDVAATRRAELREHAALVREAGRGVTTASSPTTRARVAGRRGASDTATAVRLAEAVQRLLVTFLSSGVAAASTEPEFRTFLDLWFTRLGPKFVTFLSDSVAAASTKPEFRTFLETNFARMSVDKFVAIMTGGIATRFAILDGFMAFYAACPRWTQKMTNALCKAVPEEQMAPVPAAVYEQIANVR